MLRQIRRFLRRLVRQAGAPVAVILVLVGIPAALFLPKLGSLAPTNTVFEQPIYLDAASGTAFYSDMLNAPLRAIYYGISQVTDQVLYLRLASVVVALIATFCLFLIIKRWHTLRIAVLVTLMFITSSWVLHAARFTNVEVLYLLVIPALLLVGSWFTSKSDDKKLPFAVLLLAITLYVPGAWLFLLAGMIIFREDIQRIWHKVSLPLRLISIGSLLVLMMPLLGSFLNRPMAALEWLGVSNYDSLSLSTVSSNLASIPEALFLRGLEEHTIWLTGTPVLDFFAIAMFVVGCFAYRTGNNPSRERLVFSALVIGILLIAVGGITRLGLIIPLIYIIVASGIAYMLQSWFTVFPRNPLARSIGLSLITIAVLVSSSYHLQRYFVAWPNSPVIEQLRR